VTDSEAQIEQIKDCSKDLKVQSIKTTLGDPINRQTLESLDVHTFDHIIVLSDSDRLSAQQADSRTLMTLLHLRNMAEKLGSNYTIVSEMQDVRNRNLAEVTRADDFIVSDNLVSLLLAQVSENKGLNSVFTDIFDPEGSEIYLKPVNLFVKIGVDVNFVTVVEAAARRGETAIGFRLEALSRDASKGYGIQINPEKRKKVNFSELDKVIVLAES
jgi:hypothetical protein